MIEQSRNEKKLLAIERGQFRIKQRLEAIDWEYDYLKPRVADFLKRAQLPELPAMERIELVEAESESEPAPLKVT